MMTACRVDRLQAIEQRSEHPAQLRLARDVTQLRQPDLEGAGLVARGHPIRRAVGLQHLDDFLQGGMRARDQGFSFAEKPIEITFLEACI